MQIVSAYLLLDLSNSLEILMLITLLLIVSLIIVSVKIVKSDVFRLITPSRGLIFLDRI